MNHLRIILIVLALVTLSPLNVHGQDVSVKKEIDKENAEAWESADRDAIVAYERAYHCNLRSRNIEYNQGLVESYRTLGLISLINGDLEQALKSSLAALNIVENKEDEAVIYNQIGRIYIELYDFGNAKTALWNSVRINQANKSEHLVSNYINLGNLKKQLFEIDSAFFYFELAYKLAIDYDNTNAIVSSLNNMGGLSGELNDIEQERRNYKDAYKFASEGSIQKGQIASNIAVSYFTTGEIAKAENFISIAYKLADQNKFVKGKKEARLLQSKIMESKGNYKKALEFFKEYERLSNVLIDENTNKKISQIQMRNEFDQQYKLDSIQRAQELAHLKEENEKKELIRAEQVKNRNILIYSIVVFLIAAVIVALRLFKVGKAIKKRNAIITTQKVLVEQQRDIADEQRKIVEEKNKEITESITYARRLQEAILPPISEFNEALPNSFIFYQPKDIVAGDFYWMETVSVRQETGTEELVFFAAADCTGHGVPGAMVSVVCANALNRALKEFKLYNPGQLLDKATDLVIESFDKGLEQIKDGMDIALCVYNKTTMELEYAGANNSLWLLSNHDDFISCTDDNILANANGMVFLREIKAQKQPVGQYANRVPFLSRKIKLQKGDWIVLASDGYADQFGGQKGKKYKTLTFKNFLTSVFFDSAEVREKKIAQEFARWKGELEQVDDVCVLGIQV